MKKIKDKIIIANTVSLVFISFIIILSMTIFLIHTAVEAETKEMDKLLPTVIKRLDEVPDYKLKETYRNYDYADKEYISLAVEKNGKFIYLSDDKDSFNLKKFESNKLKIKWDRFIYKKIYAGHNTKYYAIRNFEFMEAHELLYVMIAMFVLITISIIIISKIVAEHVLTPLSNIISQSNEMSKHNIDLQLTKTRDDEIGELIDVLNETFNKKSRIEIRLIFLYNIFMINITQNKLKYIFSNNNILLDSLKFCKKNNIGDSHLEYIKLSIDKFLACRDISKGFVKFKCPHCPVTHLFPVTCKSKLCPSCGYKYSRTWTENIQKHILNIEHRHVLFTVPQECRKFFFYDRSLLSKLSAAVNQVFKFIFHNISRKRKRKRKNKISGHSKYYFTDSDIVHYGLISVIHTFGRDLKWNPHVHAIVSLGGFNKNLEFRKMRYFNVDTIAGQWKYHVLKIIENGSYPNRRIEKAAKNTAAKLYKENKRFFFNVGNGDINSTKGIIKYLGRYLARAPIAEYKITDITEKEVTFFFNDLANDKKKTCITMPSERFVSHILIHLPPKNFKMVNRYGFYSRHISGRLKEAIDAFRKNIAVSRYSFYQRQMYRTFGMNPFYCPVCKVKMIVWEFYHYRYPPLKKYY